MTDHADLTSRLASAGYIVRTRQALGGGASVFSNLRHEFVVVQCSDDQGGFEEELIVDLHFREQFEIPHATAQYAEVLSALPEEFVGPVCKLRPLVQVSARTACVIGG